MKLRKINDIHFVITHGNPTTNGDYAIHSITLNVSQHHSKDNSLSEGWEKIEFSTQPLDVKITDEGIHLPDWSKVKALSSRVVKELIGGVDVEKKAEKFIGCEYEDIEDNIDQIGYNSFIRGYNQALEDNKEKKYTEEDVIRIVEKSRETGLTAEYLMMTLQPKTEWDVEIVDGKFKLKSFI